MCLSQASAQFTEVSMFHNLPPNIGIIDVIPSVIGGICIHNLNTRIYVDTYSKGFPGSTIQNLFFCQLAKIRMRNDCTSWSG